jgi:hypothetical protein
MFSKLIRNFINKIKILKFKSLYFMFHLYFITYIESFKLKNRH